MGHVLRAATASIPINAAECATRRPIAILASKLRQKVACQSHGLLASRVWQDVNKRLTNYTVTLAPVKILERD